MWERYPPTPPVFRCGENEIQASLISFASVGATPTPATNSREVSRLPVCKTGVFKQAGRDDWSITSTSHHFRIRSSNTRSNPLAAGRPRARVPLDPPVSSERSSVFRALVAVCKHPGTRRPQVKILPFRPFQNAAVAEHMRHPTSNRNDAGGIPVGSTIAR